MGYVSVNKIEDFLIIQHCLKKSTVYEYAESLSTYGVPSLFPLNKNCITTEEL